MKFGPVRTEQAIGATLAHSVAVEGKARLRKGRVLDAADVTALNAAGITEVTVARLEPDDVGEDAAAARLAQALVPDAGGANVSLTKPFTGRVNILAQGPGVALIDSAAIDAVNAIHPMITVATVPPHQQMADRGMLATIKIIAYAVPETALAQACTEARAAISLAPPVVSSVRLIVTDIPGGVGDKGWRAIQERVAAFGLDLPEPLRVAHRIADLADVLRSSPADLTLILTGSATSDPEDVAPAAVRAAGGIVDRFGMPVDPGNLLFVGALEAGAVIGLPGCARSPALNGADWVLARVICGQAVSSADIAGMGVGGLLKEIPTRPQPRRGPRT